MTNKYVVDYSIFEPTQGRPLRRVLRSGALDLLSWRDKIGSELRLDVLTKPRIQFLYFHHVFNDEVENLKALLATLARDHTFLSYSDAVDRLQRGDIDQPYICFSSDDGFKNNLNTLQAFEEFGVSCCFFINPTTIGMTDFEQVKHFCQSRLNCPPIEFMNWEDIEELQKRGHEIGSHTMNHIRLSETGIDEIEEELQSSYEIISQRCGGVSHFAYPYGRFSHFNPQAKGIIYRIGYTSCASAERGSHCASNTTLAKEDLLIRRDQVIFAWKASHIKYFLRKNAKQMTHENNLYRNA